MQKIQKQKLLGILMLTCVLMALLGISISRLHMQPGEFFLFPFSGQTPLGFGQGLAGFGWIFVLVQGFQVIILILLPIYVVISLLSKQGRRRLLRDILRLVMLFLIIMWLSEMGLRLTVPEELLSFQSGLMSMTEIPGDAVAPSGFEANPQPWMLSLIIIGIATLIAVIAFFGLKSLTTSEPDDEVQFLELANRAQTALNDIEAAKIEFDDVIIRCYAEMSQTLQVENDIQRAQAMTTHEFGQELLAKGFPAQPVQQLTQLFEQVRYGHQQPGEDAKRVAMESLREIIDFCRKPA